MGHANYNYGHYGIQHATHAKHNISKGILKVMPKFGIFPYVQGSLKKYHSSQQVIGESLQNLGLEFTKDLDCYGARDYALNRPCITIDCGANISGGMELKEFMGFE